MKLTIIDLVQLYFRSLCLVFRLPRHAWFKHILNPIDMTRYYEFSYIIKFLKESTRIANQTVLDVSSPHLIDYLLSPRNHVTKMNIDKSEGDYIKTSSKLNFLEGNALDIPFSDNSFDMCVSISVIEHIYQDYLQAINEMIRITKSGGLIYLTFPVSKNHVEEWSETLAYSSQFKDANRCFFQYRFSEKDTRQMLDSISSAVSIESNDIFWEKRDGQYSALMSQMNRKRIHFDFLRIARNFFLNFYYGFNLFAPTTNDFFSSKDFGNMFLILRKN